MSVADRRGFGTIEALIAIAIVGLLGSSLAYGITSATRARASTAKLLQATAGAAELVEQIRLGAAPETPEHDGLEFEWGRQAVAELSGLERFSVTVTWHDGGTKRLQLEGLAWQRP